MPDYKQVAIEVTANHASYSKAMNTTATIAKRTESRLIGSARKIRQAWSNVGFGRVASKFRGLGSQIAGFAGVYGFTSVIRQTKEFEERIGQVVKQGGQLNSYMKTVRDEVLKTASKYGILKGEVLSFNEAVTDETGNLKGSIAILDKMGMIATATGAKMSALASISTKLMGNVGVSVQDLPKALALIRAQEQQGAMTTAAIASYGGRIFPGIAQFGQYGKGLEGVRVAGGLAQISARGFSRDQSAQAATATQTFLRMLNIKRGDILKKLGVKVEGRNLEEVFKDIGKVASTKEGSIKASKIFAEGNKVVQQLAAAYKIGWQKSTGAIFGAKGDESLLKSQAAQTLATDAKKFDKVMADLDASVHKNMLPVFRELVKIMPAVGSGLKWTMRNAKLLLKAFLAFKAANVFYNMISEIRKLKTTATEKGGAVGLSPGGVPVGDGKPGVEKKQPSAIGLTAKMMAATYAAGKTLEQGYDRVKEIKKGIYWKGREENLKNIHGGNLPAPIEIFGSYGVEKAIAAATSIREKTEGRQLLKKEFVQKAKSELTGLNIADPNILKKKGGTKAVEEHLKKLTSARSRINAMGGDYLQRGLSEKDIKENIPSLDQLEKNIKVFSAALESFLKGKKFVINVNNNQAKTRNEDRSNLSWNWGVK